MDDGCSDLQAVLNRHPLYCLARIANTLVVIDPYGSLWSIKDQLVTPCQAAGALPNIAQACSSGSGSVLAWEPGRSRCHREGEDVSTYLIM